MVREFGGELDEMNAKAEEVCGFFALTAYHCLLTSCRVDEEGDGEEEVGRV